MKLDKEILEEKIREYRTFKSCSESTLMGLCETAEADINQKEIVKLACGFAGGMGGTFGEGTCGAVTGALIGNGILNDDPSVIKYNAKEIFTAFIAVLFAKITATGIVANGTTIGAACFITSIALDFLTIFAKI